MHKKIGFTLIEVVVAALIFTLVMVGLFSLFAGGNKHIIHARERMTSAELGKLFIEPLQAYVRQDTWDQPDNDLNLSASLVDFTSENVNNRSFSGKYTVFDGNPVGGAYDSALLNTNLRRLTTTITWTE